MEMGIDAGELYELARWLKTAAERALGAAPGQVEGVPAAHQVVLGAVLEVSGVSIGELAERTGLAQSMVSTAVADLAAQGLLVSEPDPQDRRRRLVRPSDRLAAWAGTHLRRDAGPVLEPLLAELPDEERRCVVRALALLYGAVRRDQRAPVADGGSGRHR